ncbi:unnamed protein product, partial [Prorocentrum cordatum]
ALVTLANMIERGWAWPHQLLHNWHALLLKLATQVVGNERDVGLLPTTVRRWGRMTKTVMTEWCDQKAAPWDAAARGSSALQPALLTGVRDETRAHVGVNEQSNCSMDVETFYDNMDLALMVEQSICLEALPVELYLSCLTYLAPRAVKTHGAYSDYIVPNCAMLPGCGKANHWARAFLYYLMETAYSK